MNTTWTQNPQSGICLHMPCMRACHVCMHGMYACYMTCGDARHACIHDIHAYLTCMHTRHACMTCMRDTHAHIAYAHKDLACTHSIHGRVWVGEAERESLRAFLSRIYVFIYTYTCIYIYIYIYSNDRSLNRIRKDIQESELGRSRPKTSCFSK